jgi:hypothetical protein
VALLVLADVAVADERPRWNPRGLLVRQNTFSITRVGSASSRATSASIRVNV